MRCSRQAIKISEKWGGLRKMAKAMGKDPANVYRWAKPREKGGTGGLIPSSAVMDVVDLAERDNVELTAEDWTP